MQTVYVISQGDMWRSALNAVVSIMGSSSWTVLMQMMGTLSTLAGALIYIQERNPKTFITWGALFILVNSILFIPRQDVQVIDLTAPENIYQVDNVPAGLSTIASLSTSIGQGMAQLFDYNLAKPDAVTYSKSGLLFGSDMVKTALNIQSMDYLVQSLLPPYIQQCVQGDIFIGNKYTMNQLTHSTNIFKLIFTKPSVTRGFFANDPETTTHQRKFYSCSDAAQKLKTQIGLDSTANGATWTYYAKRFFNYRGNIDNLFSQYLTGSFSYFYNNNSSASDIVNQNILMTSIRQNIPGFAGQSNDTANLEVLANETAESKQRLSWATTGIMATHWMPYIQSVLMLILVLSFPLVVAISTVNHRAFGFTTLINYAKSFIYLQTWPIMFAIINFCSTYYVKVHTMGGGTGLVLSEVDQMALEHSDVQVAAGYLCAMVPYFAHIVTKGAVAMMSHGISNMTSAIGGTASQQSSTASDGNWSFNNMAFDNVSANKFDTNRVHKAGQSMYQTDNGSLISNNADGSTTVDAAMSKLPFHIEWGKNMSSALSNQAKESFSTAQSMMTGANHSVSSALDKLYQVGDQRGHTDSLLEGFDKTQQSTISTNAAKLASTVKGYAIANNVSEAEAFQQLKSQSGVARAEAKAGIDSSKSIIGKVVETATGASGSLTVSGSKDDVDTNSTSKGSTGTNSTTETKNAQFARDFRESVEAIDTIRASKSGSGSDTAGNNVLNNISSDFKDTNSKYEQYSDSTTRGHELSDMASKTQTLSANESHNMDQKFVNWVESKYSSDDAKAILTDSRSADVEEKRSGAIAEFTAQSIGNKINSNFDDNKGGLGAGLQTVTNNIANPTAAANNNNSVVSSSVPNNVKPQGVVSSEVEHGTEQAKDKVKQTNTNLRTGPSKPDADYNEMKSEHNKRTLLHQQAYKKKDEEQDLTHSYDPDHPEKIKPHQL